MVNVHNVQFNEIKDFGFGIEDCTYDENLSRVILIFNTNRKPTLLKDKLDCMTRTASLDSDVKMAIGLQTYIPDKLVDCEFPWNKHSGRYPWGEFEKRIPKVAHIFYDDVATVVFWTDGTKTVVKCPEGTPYDEYSAFCAALAKKIYGNNSKLQREIKNKAKYSKKRQIAKIVCGEHSVRKGNTFYPYKADRIIGKVTSVNETDKGLEVEVTKND